MPEPPERDALVIETDGPEATRAVGRALGRALSPGTLVALHGGLGAGKTTLVQGLAQGLGCDQPAISPTFTLVRELPGGPGRPDLWHADLYRLERRAEAAELGLDDGLTLGAVVAVEWPERLAGLEADERLDVRLEAVAEGSRRIGLQARGGGARRALAEAAAALVGQPGVGEHAP